MARGRPQTGGWSFPSPFLAIAMASGAISESFPHRRPPNSHGRPPTRKRESGYRSFLKNNPRRQLLWQEIVGFFSSAPALRYTTCARQSARERLPPQTMLRIEPPSTPQTDEVTNEARSEARKTMTFATSSGCPRRLSGS